LAAGNAPVVKYYVDNAASGKVLDDPNFSTSNGTLIQQFQLNGGLNQQWQVVPLANGNYEVFNASSGKVLDDPNFSTSNRTIIQQFQLNGGLNQQWKLLPA
jgi:endo-1,4-beta-xylanase